MKQSINSSTFRGAFQSMRPDNFTDEGLDALFSYLEGYEEETGEEMELDVIALCCEFSELTLNEAMDYDACAETGCTTLEACMQSMQDCTMVIPVDDDTFIIQDF